MSISLAELLPLVGRLDDEPGFDTPRERFRRFLLDRVTDVPTARALIEDCQRSVGEQRHRALQDLIVVVGRLLGFAITFGTYERSADDVRARGRWRSPGLLDVALEIRTDQTPPVPLEDLARAAAACGAGTAVGQIPSIGVCVVARQYVARAKLDQQVAAQPHIPNLRIVSVGSLLSLAAHVSANRVSPAEVVELLRSGFALDFVIDLLDRPAADNRPSDSTAEPGRPVPTDCDGPAFWVATISGDEITTAEQLLESVIAHRGVLPIFDGADSPARGSPEDWVCFFLADQGIVGHARLASIIENGANVVRHADRFRRVFRLSHVTLYAQPIVQALRASRPFAVPVADALLGGSCLTPITRHDFLALTLDWPASADTDDARSATA